jgi:hypothetical protein
MSRGARRSFRSGDESGVVISNDSDDVVDEDDVVELVVDDDDELIDGYKLAAQELTKLKLRSRSEEQCVRYVLREVLCSAARRPDVTTQSLNCLLYHRTYIQTTHASRLDIYDVALHTGKRNVVEWAVHHGFVPTSEQLRRILFPLGYVTPV